ncbi:SIMPL domain-containing protein [Veillonella parvula]
MKLSKHLLSKAVAIAAICATMGTTTLAAPQGTFDTSEINITGQASRSVAPNYAILTLGITSQNTNINAAKSNNDRIMSNLISQLANLGVAKKDIYTSSISINPTSDYQDGKRINTGYNVSNHVTVKINNLDNVGKVVDAAVSAGANDINNLSFQNDVSQQLSDSLTTEAIQSGRHKAEVIAAALGRTLGPVKTVSISTTETSTMDSGYYRNPVMLKAALETTTPVEKGSLIVSQDANITYYLQ